MPNLKLISRLKGTKTKVFGFDYFIRKLNADVARLNSLIYQYKELGKKEKNLDQKRLKSIELLKKILRLKQRIENTYSDKHVNECPDFLKKLEGELFEQIQSEFAKNGITSLYGQLEEELPKALPPNNFSEILMNMSPKKVNSLMTILSINPLKPDKFTKLYKKSDDGYLEFNNFVKNNAISFLGGKNSKNFKITPNNGSPPYVLQLENRLGTPKLPVVHLGKRTLKNTLTPVMAERQSTIVKKGTKITRTILITEFCAGGDLIAHSNELKAQGVEDKTQSMDEKRITSALQIYTQMIDILLRIESEGCVFADMKNSNWLIEPNGRLRIADTKSFMFCEENGELNFSKIAIKTAKCFPKSNFLLPEEVWGKLFTGYKISADKMQAFMFGKNLYQYLTLYESYHLHHQKDKADFNFGLSIFKTEKGQKLQQLIEKLLTFDPVERMSLKDAKEQLYAIQNSDALSHQDEEIDSSIADKKNEIQDLLNEIEEYGFGTEDHEMKHFIQNKKNLLSCASDLITLEDIKAELKSALNQQVITDDVREIINNFRTGANLFTVGMHAKADRIEKAIGEIPVKDRGRILEHNYLKGHKLQLAIASHRLFTSFQSVKVNEKGIVESTAAKSYVFFKNKVEKKSPPDLDHSHKSDKLPKI